MPNEDDNYQMLHRVCWRYRHLQTGLLRCKVVVSYTQKNTSLAHEAFSVSSRNLFGNQQLGESVCLSDRTSKHFDHLSFSQRQRNFLFWRLFRWLVHWLKHFFFHHTNSRFCVRNSLLQLCLIASLHLWSALGSASSLLRTLPPDIKNNVPKHFGNTVTATC